MNQILELVKDDLVKVNAAIQAELNSDVALINQLGNYIISSGGKRIRPIIALLVAKALNYHGDKHIITAAFIEFIHTATLLHDDVVDESDLRRGKSTANALFGNAASVLVGDYIYTRSFQMMVRTGSFKVLTIMSEATNVIAEGEVQQLINCNDPNITKEQYLEVIYRKTARLFEATSHSAAVLAEANEQQEYALQQYGKYLGTAFQIIDDLLDYSADSNQKLGKNLGDDLNEGKPTLPLLHAMHHAPNADDRAMIRQAIELGNGRHLLDRILQVMDACGSLAFTLEVAQQEAKKAFDVIAILPDSPYKKALQDLALLSVKRDN
ncbi:octaprenyl diphosphate synthase [Gilliamella sp. B3766]|nr:MULTISPECIES: octaprenyl diphosphate synthase [unclassified Gilliamella]MCX8601832.1 octaprenyl diphosphate synthase [Gilliamella sp. B3722]MCX8607972.1 octaprenyl diphosphate synthase [Gilliamella sp. B3771]MCX8611093.1 octaprenyl diphosphate synthase [Gilliamella sp. B3891]MCX8613566.1 octaprenyl diphosphate synthase [Gilliamella sp. B3773]MCX8614444.1 octaprenyl diphosphate synthase [Gilliamella sp. B3770]